MHAAYHRGAGARRTSRSTPVARGHGDVGVHAHAADARAALALQNGEIAGVDAVAHAEHTLAAAGTRATRLVTEAA